MDGIVSIFTARPDEPFVWYLRQYINTIGVLLGASKHTCQMILGASAHATPRTGQEKLVDVAISQGQVHPTLTSNTDGII
jgi:hypothetical protein